VDVVVVRDKGEFSKNPSSKVLFQNLKVLGTGQKTVTGPEDKPQIVPTVTLEVTPEQGELLALAAVEGRISLVLRGQLPVGTLGADDSMPQPVATAPLSPNQRAVTVRVDTASGVAPGNRIDVMLVMDKGDWAKYPLAKILFQNLKVLDTDKKQRVTLAATPQQAVDLTWVAQVGRISLVLSGSPGSGNKTVEADARRLFGHRGPSLRQTVPVIRGIESGDEAILDSKNFSASPAAVRR
jgi:Flp pilus assembly protein CpaB